MNRYYYEIKICSNYNGSGGSRIFCKGASTLLGDVVLKILYVEMKESGPLGSLGTLPLDPTMNGDLFSLIKRSTRR